MSGRFPTLSAAQYEKMLRLPSGHVRCVIDTDTRNEIDDQYALAWALLSQDSLQIDGIYAAPYSFLRRLDELRAADRARQNPAAATDEERALLPKYMNQLGRLDAAGTDINDLTQIDPQSLIMVEPGRGMELSYHEILLCCEKMGMDCGDNVFRGADRYLQSLDAPVESEATAHLIEQARTASPESPLYVLAVGALTNVASALLLAPDIIERIVVVWTAGYPTTVMDVEQPSFNMEQDILASQLLFDSGVPLVYIPGFHVGAQLSLSLPEMEAWVRGKGAIGDYLHWLYTHNPHYAFQGISGHFARSWIIWDLVNIAWLLSPGWLPSYITDAPWLSADCRWQRHGAPRHPIREALDINRDAIFRDFFGKLASL
ncbi:MAG: nucleoside hydrolase [Chloroflexi bacterium]|nr:nucleoside hydrolase [Chloroflexota bacterium]